MEVGILDDKYNTFIVLENITLNIYIVADQIEQESSWLSKNFNKINKKIKRPQELTNVVIMLRFDSDYFDDKLQIKGIPISSIKKNSRFTLIIDDREDFLEKKFSTREDQIIRLFKSLDQKKLVEKTILEIQELNTEEKLMDYYIRNSDWISFKDLFNLYYTFKVIK